MNKNSAKVMFLCDYQAPYGGNFVPSLLALDKALEEHNIESVYVFPEEANKRSWFEILVNKGKKLECFSKKVSKIGMIYKIQELITKHGITILHTHFFSMSIIIALSFINPHLKIVTHLHSDFSAGKMTWKIRVFRFVFYQFLAKRVCLLSVSSELKRYNEKKIIYVPNGLATERIPCKQIDSTIVREQNGVKDNEVLLEIFAWSPYVKGLDIAVSAVKVINEREDYKIKLAIVCGRENTPKKMQEWISDNTQCTGKEQYLIYLMPTEDVFAYHKAADILISASRSEGFPYSILEMLSLGKRCIISEIPGTLWARNYASVMTFESGNVNTCVDAICKAISELPPENSKVSEKVISEYSITQWAETVLKCYGIGN